MKKHFLLFMLIPLFNSSLLYAQDLSSPLRAFIEGKRQREQDDMMREQHRMEMERMKQETEYLKTKIENSKKENQFESPPEIKQPQYIEIYNKEKGANELYVFDKNKNMYVPYYDAPKINEYSDREKLRKQDIINQILKIHPDFEDIINGEIYWEWIDKQENILRSAGTNSNDPKDIIWALTEYKKYLFGFIKKPSVE